MFIKNIKSGFKNGKIIIAKDKGNITKDTKGTKNKFKIGLKKLIEKLLYIVIGKLNKKEKIDILNKLLKYFFSFKLLLKNIKEPDITKL